jgi:hypothetical protein
MLILIMLVCFMSLTLIQWLQHIDRNRPHDSEDVDTLTSINDIRNGLASGRAKRA